MNKRLLSEFLFVIALTSVGQLLAVLFFPLMSSILHVDVLSQIALIDSSLALVVSILGFGVNVTTTRDVALSGSHIGVVRETQRARLSLASILTAFAIVAFPLGLIGREFFYAFIFSLVIVLNYDYVLYGLGKPERAAVASFVRLAVPLVVFMAGAVVGLFDAAWEYIMVLMIFLLLSSLIVSRFCDTPLFFRPRLDFYKVYLSAGWVGLTGLTLVFNRIGFLPFLGSDFGNDELVALVIVLKFGLFAIAGKRILIQFIYKKLLVDRLYNIVNYSLTAFGLMFVGAVLLSAGQLEKTFADFGLSSDLYILMSTYVASMLFFPLSDAKLLLLKKDKGVFFANLICSLGFILCVIFFNELLHDASSVMSVLVVLEFSISLSLLLCVIRSRRLAS